MLPPGLDPKVVEVYTAVGKVLSRYSAGKIPKAFKVVPTLKNWEEARHWFQDSTHCATCPCLCNGERAQCVVGITWQLLHATPYRRSQGFVCTLRMPVLVP